MSIVAFALWCMLSEDFFSLLSKIEHARLQTGYCSSMLNCAGSKLPMLPCHGSFALFTYGWYLLVFLNISLLSAKVNRDLANSFLNQNDTIQPVSTCLVLRVWLWSAAKPVYCSTQSFFERMTRS